MKKLLALTCMLLLSLGLVLTGCGGGDEGTGTTGNTDTIKIGLNYELSGDVATYGKASVEGIEMAIDEINAAGGVLGKQIELVSVDNKSDASEVVSVATKLMTQDGVVAIIGPATSGNFKAEEPLAEQNGIPILSGSATADDVTVDANGVKEFAFRLCFNDSFQGKAMATYASKELSAQKAVIIKDNSSDYAIGLADNFRSTFESLGGEIVDEEAYVSTDKDFNSILTKIRDKEFDVIYLPGYYQTAGLIIKQARDLSIAVPILGADGFDSPILAELAGATALNDVYFTNHYSSLDQDPTVTAFVEAFKAKYNKEPDAFNALGYDCGHFIADAITRAGSADPAAIKDALAATKDFTGVTGSFSMDENHNPVKSIVVIKMENGVAASSSKVDMQ